jgi:hypothetical protein
MLPKGSYGGVPYQFYVVVSKVVPYKYRKTDIPMVGTGSQYVDGYPMGYPFDRPVYWDKVFFDIPNAYFYETKIYHRDADAVNYSQQDYYSKQQNYRGSYDYSKQQDYTTPQYYKQQNRQQYYGQAYPKQSYYGQQYSAGQEYEY